MKFILSGGGSGGHVSPALAIAAVLRQGGHELAYVGNRNSFEEKMARAEGMRFFPIHVQKLYRSLTPAHFKFPFILGAAIRDSLKILRQERPDAVICTGGFVSGPISIAAVMKRIPLYFWDGNSYPGLTTRLLARKIRIVFTAFESTAGYLKNARCAKLWIPLRKQAHTTDWQPSQVGLSGDKPLLLVTGGSQGSLAINKAVSAAMSDILALGYELLWQTGKTGFAEFSKKHIDTTGVYIFEFTSDMQAMMQAASAAVSRAGAMSIAELEAYRCPAVLIPLPSAAENHQYYNALEQEKKGYAILLKQSELSATSLVEALSAIKEQEAKMQEQLALLAPNSSAEDIAATIINDLSKEPKSC